MYGIAPVACPFVQTSSVTRSSRPHKYHASTAGTATPTARNTRSRPFAGGSFFVGYVQDLPVATGAWRMRSDVEAIGTTRCAEGKRMYVVESARGAGRARAMLAHLERTAAECGAEVMILETGLPQHEGIALYESSGYVRIPGFGHYRDYPDNRCFARRISG